jgi:hypothetical protein
MRVMAYLSRWPIGPAEWTCSARTSAYSCQEPTQAFRDKTRFVYDKWANDIKFFVARPGC